VMKYPRSSVLRTSHFAQVGGPLVFIVIGSHRHWTIILVLSSSSVVTQFFMPFDFHCRYGLFTYAQCADLDPWAVCNHFASLSAECIIGREEHADGGTHLHAFVDFGRRRRFRVVSFADVCDFHPNISKSRGTPEHGYDYAIKDGEVVAGGLERPKPVHILSKNAIWSQILDATSRDEFFQLVRELAPADLAKCFPALSRFADSEYATPCPEYEGPNYEDPRFDYGELQELISFREGLGQELDGKRGKFRRPQGAPLPHIRASAALESHWLCPVVRVHGPLPPVKQWPRVILAHAPCLFRQKPRTLRR